MAQKAMVTYEGSRGKVTVIMPVACVEMNDSGHFPLAVYRTENSADPEIYAWAVDFDVKADE